jgi:hypothetical protein
VRSLCGPVFWGRPPRGRALRFSMTSKPTSADGADLRGRRGRSFGSKHSMARPLSVQMAWLWRHGAALQRANIWSIVAEAAAVRRFRPVMPALVGRFAFQTTDAPTAFGGRGEAGAVPLARRRCHRCQGAGSARDPSHPALSTRRDDRRRGERAGVDTLPLQRSLGKSRNVLSPGSSRGHPR